jgi:ABC-type proline/glycine betaine transport system ATPase subunit
MTSNIGSHYILEAGNEPDAKAWSKIEETVREELRKHFRPEFLNRVDEVIVFRQLGRPELRRIVELQLVGLDPALFAERWPRELSGGQRQRVAVARALAIKPDIILLDEPFGALDAITRVELQSTFDRVRRRLGVTTVLVTHDLHEAFDLADRVVVMRRGRVEQVATPQELRRAPAGEYVRELLLRARVVPA